MAGIGAERAFKPNFSSLDDIFGFIDGLFARSPVDSRTDYVVKFAVEELWSLYMIRK